MAFNSSALKDAVSENAGILKVTGIGILVAIVLLVIVGVMGGLVSDGTISVPAGTNTTIQGIVTQAGTIFTTIIGVFATIAGFVVIVALMKAFGVDISLSGGRK